MSRLEALKTKFAAAKAQKIATITNDITDTIQPVPKPNELAEKFQDINNNVLSMNLIVPFYIKQLQIYNSKKGTIHTEVLLSDPKTFININPQKTNGNVQFENGDMCKILAYPLDTEKNVPSVLPNRNFKYNTTISEIQINIRYQSDQNKYKEILDCRTKLTKILGEWRTQTNSQLDTVFAALEKKFEEVLLQKVTPEDLSDWGETTEDIAIFFISELLSSAKEWAVETLTLGLMLNAAPTSNVYAFAVAFAIDKLFSAGIEGFVKQTEEKEKQAQEINDNRQKALDLVRDKILPALKKECQNRIAQYEDQFGGEAEDMDNTTAMAGIIDRFTTFSTKPMATKLADALGNTFSKLEELLKNKLLDTIRPKNNISEQKNNGKESPKPKPNYPSTHCLELMLEKVGIKKTLAQQHTAALQKGYNDWCMGKYPIAAEHIPEIKDLILKSFGSYQISLLSTNDIADFSKIVTYFGGFDTDSDDKNKVQVLASLFQMKKILEHVQFSRTTVNIRKADLQIQVTEVEIGDILDFDFSKIIIKSISYQLDVEAVLTMPMAHSEAKTPSNIQLKSTIKFN